MTDREIVIRAVDSCFDFWLDANRYLHPLELENVRQIKADAIALLKEQEAKKINIWQAHCGMKYGLCPKCGEQVDTLVNPNYCGYCGQAVKWE